MSVYKHAFSHYFAFKLNIISNLKWEKSTLIYQLLIVHDYQLLYYNLKFDRMIDMYSKYDSVHRNKFFYAIICINKYVITSISCMLSWRKFKYFSIKSIQMTKKNHIVIGNTQICGKINTELTNL